ncbi:MAG: TonB family protein, partial [Woeseiaceae bacterium]|nr:TonB family protein [Woeseiaceae bacterium]
AKKPPVAAPADAAPDSIEVTPGDSLSTPFDGNDTGFVETVTGLVSKVGRGFSAKDSDEDTGPDGKAAAVAADTAPAAGGDSQDGDTGRSGMPKIILAAAVAVALVGAGIWMFAGTSDNTPAETAPIPDTVADDARPDVGTPAVVVAEKSASAGDLLDEARLARDAGQIVYPAGSSAIELYTQALAADPGDKTVAAELAVVVDQAFSMAEAAMLEGRIGDAETALQRVGIADAGHPRLAFLNAQLEQMQLRSVLDDARAAIREARFEDAAAALATANTMNVTDTREIDSVSAELAGARRAQRVDDVLVQAADRLARGMLIEPANDNARYYYDLVLSNDPANAAAQQGLVAVASKLVLQARTEIDQGQYEEAESLLGIAAEMDPESVELQAATIAIEESRQRIAAEQRRQRAARDQAARAEAERLAALQQAEEQRRALAAAAIDKAEPEPPISNKSETLVESGTADDSAVEKPIQRAAATPVAAKPSAEYIPAESPEAVAGPTRGITTPAVAVSSLTRTKYVAPKYPRAAERRSLSGWVDVTFTVSTDGSTSNIEVIDSDPGTVFVNAATKAIERWEFEPVVENGELVEKRAGVRMMFAIE